MGQKKKKKIFREGTYILSSFKTEMFKCCSFRACICIMLMCNLISNLIYFRKFYIYRTHVSKNAQLKWLWTHQEEIDWFGHRLLLQSMELLLPSTWIKTLCLGKTECWHRLFQTSDTKMVPGGNHCRWIMGFHELSWWFWLCRELKLFAICSQRTEVLMWLHINRTQNSQVAPISFQGAVWPLDIWFNY